MKTICTIEARMRSSRLPGKVLKTILGKPMLERMIERLKRCRTLDGIVVATSDNPEDLGIMELAERLGVGCFRGSESDVLSRVVGAAKAYDADIIVETCGDSPLIDPAVVDKVTSDFFIGGTDYTWNAMTYNVPPGSDIRVFTTAALDHIHRTSDDPADREHVSIHFYEHRDKYRVRDVKTELPLGTRKLRLSVDTPEDFQFATKIFEELYPLNPCFSTGDIIALLERKPEIRLLNKSIEQKDVR